MPRNITVYREINGKVEKECVTDAPRYGGLDVDNYHQRIINTYHQLECEGKLGTMSTAAKKFVRNVHTYAQEPGYWPSDYSKEERGV